MKNFPKTTIKFVFKKRILSPRQKERFPFPWIRFQEIIPKNFINKVKIEIDQKKKKKLISRLIFSQAIKTDEEKEREWWKLHRPLAREGKGGGGNSFKYPISGGSR